MNTFEKTKESINQFIESPRFIEIFQRYRDDIKKIINDIFSDIDILQNETDEPLKVEINHLTKLVDLIMFNSVEACISDQECKDFKNISELVFNYNNNSIKDESIMRRTTFLNNFLDGFLTFRDSIQLFKTVSERLNKFTNFNPPSFEISKHYIGSIFGEDKDKCGD